ncbi:MAG: dihydrofolate reductase [Hyphomicrobiaceae bacterium]
MHISLIVAAAENGVIGRDGRIPWHQRSDLRRFRALTMGKPVVMGRKTFQSLPNVLDGRDNIVVSRDPAFQPDGAHAAPDVEAAIALARTCAARRGVDEIMVIGGAQVYAAVLPMADRIYLTRVHATLPGDTFFADPDPAAWAEVRRESLLKADGDDHAATLMVLERRRL